VTAITASAATIAGLCWVFWPRGAEEIRDLPPPERAALVERTLETLRTTCARFTGPDLTEYCSDQAELIVDLEECGPDCRAIADRFTAKPTR
jgi:hypothetical protein